MSGLQRRHHGRQVISNESNSGLDGNYNPKSKSSTHKPSSWPLLMGLTFILALILYLQSNTNSNTYKSSNSNDLKLITVYPWPVASTIHEIEGKTEILITNNNRESVRAIRTSIVMANNLRRRRRRKSVLLRFTAFIASLGSRSGEKVVDGDVELKAYGEVKMREYLLEHEDTCWDGNGGENTIFQQYSEIVDTIVSEGDDEDRISELWDDAINLFAWCQFVNGDARGYIAHGTNLQSQEVLEESRLKGVGLIGPDNTLIDGTHYSPLFIIPSENNEDLLRSHTSESWSNGNSKETPLLFGIKDRDLDRWSEQWIEGNKGRDGDWLFFK